MPKILTRDVFCQSSWLSYSGSGVLFVIKRVFVSFPFRFRFVFVAFRFLPFLRTFLTKKRVLSFTNPMTLNKTFFP